jgi:hypothetical protein
MSARRRNVRRIGGTALWIALAPLRYPGIWAWPLAAWMVLRAGALHAPPLTRYAALAYWYMPALGLILVGCLPSFFTRRPARAAAGEAPFLSRRVLGWLAVALLLAATAVRVWKVCEWPPEGVGFEEMQIAARANMSPDPIRNLLELYRQPGEHTLTAYAASVSYALLGAGFFELRLPFMIAGLLCPFLFYAVCRKLVSREVSLFALALFAVSWWQIAASRVADEIFFPLWAELAILWLLLEFEDTGRTWAAFCLALLSGLLIYEYTSYHLVPPLVIGYLLARAVLFVVRVWWRADPARSRARRLADGVRTYGPGALVMALVWIIVAQFQLAHDIRAGMGSWFAGGVAGHSQDPDGLLMKLQSPGADLAAFLLRRLAIPLKAAYWPNQAEFCRNTGIGAQPAFDEATAIAMAIGIVLVALTPVRRFHALVLVWTAVVVAGAALLPQSINVHRYYMGLPLYYLLIALGAEVLWRRLRAPTARWLLLAVFAAAATFAAVDNLHYLFWNLVPNQEMRANWRFPRTALANWIRERKRDEFICVVANDDMSVFGGDVLQPEWRWMVQQWNVRVSHSGDCIPAPQGTGGPLYYIFATPNPPTDLEATLRAHYPQAQELERIEMPNFDFVARTFYVRQD